MDATLHILPLNLEPNIQMMDEEAGINQLIFASADQFCHSDWLLTLAVYSQNRERIKFGTIEGIDIILNSPIHKEAKLAFYRNRGHIALYGSVLTVHTNE